MGNELTTIQTISKDRLDLLNALDHTPKWVTDLRNRAWEAYNQIPFPTTYEPSWKRTDLRGLQLDAVSITDAKPDINILKDDQHLQANFNLGNKAAVSISFVDGVFFDSKGTDQLPKGVIFQTLQDAFHTHSELLQKYLGKAVLINSGKFEALHYSMLNDGVLLYVPAGIKVEHPLQVNLYSQLDGKADFSHLIIIMEDSSEASLIWKTESLSETSKNYHFGVVELFVNPSAKLSMTDIQNQNNKSFHFSTQKSYLKRDSSLEWITVGLGGKSTRQEMNTHLIEPGGKVNMLGMVNAAGRQHFDYHTLQEHEAPYTFSDLLYNTVLDDHSHTVFNGMIKIHPEGQKTDAYQKNNNLMLNPDARADSLPGLEIEANDLRCTHGSATSDMDESQLFYLQSRGISRKTAEHLIVEGFFEVVLARIQSEELREIIRSLILNKLNISGDNQ